MVSACSGSPGKRVEVDARAERDDELVVMEDRPGCAGALHDDHLLLVEVDAHDFGLTYLDGCNRWRSGTTASEEWMVEAATSGSSGWNTK